MKVTHSPSLLMVDNYDSFTYNLVQYLGELGAEVETVRNDDLSVEEVLSRHADGIVISPGPCTPTQAGISVELIRRASGRVPLLGVCLGHQSLGVAFGGRVIRAGRIMHGKTSPVRHQNTGMFAGLPNPMTATRYHSLTVAAEDLPAALVPDAWTDEPDGTAIIMGMRHREHPTFGVQFHPESILTECGKGLLANFLKETT